MKNLTSKFFSVLSLFLLLACESAYKMETVIRSNSSHLDDLFIIDANKNRVYQECYYLNADGENEWRYQYFMYILNGKNEVITIMQPTNQDKESCQSQIRKIDIILKKQSHVKVCARGNLKIENNESLTEFINFPQFGKHKTIYKSLSLDSICSGSKCVSNNEVYVDTCPGFVKK